MPLRTHFVISSKTHFIRIWWLRNCIDLLNLWLQPLKERPVDLWSSHYATLQLQLQLHCVALRYTTLHYTTLHGTTLHQTRLHYTAAHNTTVHYTPFRCTVITPHRNYNCNYNCATQITLHQNYKSTTLQLQMRLHFNYYNYKDSYNYARLHQVTTTTTRRDNYNYSFKPHYTSTTTTTTTTRQLQLQLQRQVHCTSLRRTASCSCG